MKMNADIRYSQNANNLTGFVALTERGRQWLQNWTGGEDFGSIEDEYATLVIQAIEDAGLKAITPEWRP